MNTCCRNVNNLSATFTNNGFDKVFYSNNYKLDTITRRIALDNGCKDVKRITSIKTIPKVLSYNFLGVPASFEIPNVEGLHSTGAKIAVHGELYQTITYDDCYGVKNNIITEVIPFSQYITLDISTFNFNVKPCIDVVVESVHIDIKNSKDIFEKISLLVDIF